MKAIVLLILLLAGCKTIPKVDVVEVPGPTRYIELPGYLTADCPIEDPTSTAPMEAVRVAHARKESLQDCNRRMRSIRALQGTVP
jgi:hypothetical protein